MNLLFHAIYAAHARSTHHKLALHSLLELKGPHTPRWVALFLKHHRALLTGAKDPDRKFKDFRNHVLHVEQNHWGGAPQAARKWYGETVAALRKRDFARAVYAAGVLSHYYSDPLMPFHTGSSQKEQNVHRAAEWSICHAYDDLREIRHEDLGEIRVRVPKGQTDWLQQMVIRGAEKSHKHYQELIDHYDIHSGVIDPPSGLDGRSMRFLAELLGTATVGFARILDKAFEESGVTPPRTNLTLETFLATLELPIRWVTNRMADTVERRQIEAIYNELCETGRVDVTLPAENRVIRDAVAAGELDQRDREERVKRRAEQVEEKAGLRRKKIDVDEIETEDDDHELLDEPKPTLAGRFAALNSFFRRKPREEEPAEDVARDEIADSDEPSDEDYIDDPVDSDTYDEETVSFSKPSHEDDESSDSDSPRYHLNRADNVVEAPSIGPKTAKRLERIGVHTVADLLAADPQLVAQRVNKTYVTPELVNDWQDQAQLVCSIPNLRGHDAQILVACGLRTAREVAAADPDELASAADAFCDTVEGQRVVRSGKSPDREEVGNWIAWAATARREAA